MVPRSFVVLVAVGILLGGCGTAEPLAGATQTATGSAASAPAAPPSNAAAEPAAASAAAPAVELELGAIEALVKADLARYLGVSAAEIAVAAAEARTWIGANLGCGTRDIEGDALPVAGYLITLRHNDTLYHYHTDRNGNFIRCRQPSKPLGPIAR